MVLKPPLIGNGEIWLPCMTLHQQWFSACPVIGKTPTCSEHVNHLTVYNSHSCSCEYIAREHLLNWRVLAQSPIVILSGTCCNGFLNWTLHDKLCNGKRPTINYYILFLYLLQRRNKKGGSGDVESPGGILK